MDGVILINKEKAYTSNDVVQIVKHTLKEKTGHIGTLDPNATGVLPILIGKGTKISKYLINHDKIYEAVLQLGKKTQTADAEGKIIEEKKVEYEILEQDNIEKVLKSFIGKSKQIPPMYSAIKIDGKKLYDYARKGQEVDIKPRDIEIYELKLININIKENQITFLVNCSKGTYIRTLCENIAEKLGTVGYMKELNRIQVGNFNLKDTIKIDELKAHKEDEAYIKQRIISIEQIVSIFMKLQLNENEMYKFLNGVKIDKKFDDGIYRIYNNENIFVGTGIIKNQLLKRDVVLRGERVIEEHNLSNENEMIKNIKAVFLDVDGTLTNSKHEITENVKNSIIELRKKDIYVILCSGRKNKDVCMYSKEVCSSEYAISSNGAQIYNYNKKENFFKDEIRFDKISKIWNYCEKNNLELVFNTLDYQYGNNVFCSNIYEDRIVIKDIAKLKNKEIYQIIINSNNYYDMKECEKYINEIGELKIANYSRDYLKNNRKSKEPYYIFINNSSTDKGTAINFFLKEMNIKKEDTICFGDRINDLTMFNSCGKTVAMKNADDELKKVANYITLSNNEDGVAFFLNRYFK